MNEAYESSSLPRAAEDEMQRQEAAGSCDSSISRSLGSSTLLHSRSTAGINLLWGTASAF